MAEETIGVSGNRMFRDHVRTTPLLPLGEKRNLFCKLECCQIGGSFKIRGALSTLLAMIAQGNTRGVITASMGNTATSLAYAGKLLEYPVTVVMPQTVSPTKLNATRKIGAEVILKGQVGDDALAHSVELARKRQIFFLHPHKTPPFLEGNATIAQEIFEELPGVTRIFIPIGGGGLASGICRYVRRRGLPVRLVGVEAAQAPAFWLSFREGRPVRLERMETIADALTLLEPDPDVFAELHQHLDHVATVSEDDIIRMMKRLLDEYRVITEPGGAASLAAMLREDSGEPAVAIISGGNVSLAEFQELTSRVES